MGCCGSKGSSNAAVGKKPGTALSPMGGGAARRTSGGGNTGNHPNTSNNGSIGLLNQQEQNRIRSREKAILALVDTFKANEDIVPSANWRRQYIKVAGIGPGVASAIADRLMGKTRPGKKVMAAGAAASASSSSASAQKHGILTLDLRAMKIGDEGFASLSKALAQDTVVENVILSGNQITDVGAKSFVTALTAASSHVAKCKTENGPSGSPAVSSEAGASHIRLLVLADNPISSAGISALASCLDRLPVLERLEVGRGQMGEENEPDDDHLTEEAVNSLVRLVDASPSLQTLVFKGTGNPYRTDFSPAGLTTFVSEVVGRSHLTSLFLQECFTTKPVFVPGTTFAGNRKKGAVAASAATTTSPASPPGRDAQTYLQPISALTTAITARTTQLNTLVLRFPLTDSAVGILCKGVAHAILLANLSLRGCDMSAAGLRLLGDALRSNRTITALDVSYQSNVIAHPMVLQELRSSSKRRQSYVNYTDLRDSQGSSGTDSMPSKEEREHPLLPIIQVLHTNRTITQLIMLGVNISVDDIEELCSCVEQSGNHVLTDVAYTSIGADALNMKLENFLSANREYNYSAGVSAVSQRSMVRPGSNGTLFADTMTDHSQTSDHSPRASRTLNGGAAGTASVGRSGAYYANASIPKGAGPKPANIPHHPPNSRESTPFNASISFTEDAAGTSLPSLPPMRRDTAAAEQRQQQQQTTKLDGDATSLADVELRVGGDDGENEEVGTAPYLSQTRNGKVSL